jgi:hypothetical protein
MTASDSAVHRQDSYTRNQLLPGPIAPLLDKPEPDNMGAIVVTSATAVARVIQPRTVNAVCRFVVSTPTAAASECPEGWGGVCAAVELINYHIQIMLDRQFAMK